MPTMNTLYPSENGRRWGALHSARCHGCPCHDHSGTSKMCASGPPYLVQSVITASHGTVYPRLATSYPVLPPGFPLLLDVRQKDTWAWHSEPTSSGPHVTSCYSSYPGKLHSKSEHLVSTQHHMGSHFAMLRSPIQALQFRPGGSPGVTASWGALSTSPASSAPQGVPSRGMPPICPLGHVGHGRVGVFLLQLKCPRCAWHLASSKCLVTGWLN